MNSSAPPWDALSDSLQVRQEKFEARRQALLLYVANGVAAMLLLIFGILAATTGRTALAVFVLMQAALSITLILLLKFTGNLKAVNFGFVCGLVTLFSYLLATGGVDHTGPLWAYPMAAATLFLQGARRGLCLLALLFCIALLVFSVEWPGIVTAVYAFEFKLRFLTTFAALVLFAALHEFARARFQASLLQVSAQLDQLSHTDPLTGLPNRRYMLGRLEAENHRYLRHRRAYSILYADVDHFKRINDHCGHQAGDAALQAIAQALRCGVRQADEICRWGGEEFLILLPETEQMQAVEVAEKLRAAIAALEVGHDGTPLPLTMSFGVHTVDGQGQIDTFIHRADLKLYLAKKNGRNCVVSGLPYADAPAEEVRDGLPFAFAG